jgi:hypothetical protein
MYVCKSISGKENGATGAGSSVVVKQVLFLLFRKTLKTSIAFL